MSIEQSKTIAQNIFAALNERDLDGVVAYYAPGSRFHGWAPETLNADGYKAAMSALLAGFPDSRFPVEEIIAEGDKVVVRHRFQGTHQAEFQGIPATGQAVSIDGIALLRLDNGAVVEGWLNADLMGMMQQLGVAPGPGQP
ncbi:MAG: ester cyclase [Anaerolineales bacterium]|nr:ester cyclase [Anaerolineales bacterium]